MSKPDTPRLVRAETLTAIGIIIAAAAFLVPTFFMQPMSALLPAAMLVGLLLLGAAMLVSDQRKAAAGEPAVPVTTSPKRVIGAFLLILGYALCVDFIGFYVSTIIAVPLVAYIFGFRSPAGLALATAIVVAGIYIIFNLAMSQDFPAGRLWNL
ncbi:tripartite tricarboxylate transporter TctB family protein [Paracoccaceae bacterium GXU_MW_L88]